MISISREALSPELIDLIMPMIEENHDETGQFEELDIDWESYLAMGDAINVFMIRTEFFCGIMIVYIGPYPHNKEQLYAEQLTYFIQKEHRHYSPKVMLYVEAYCRHMGAEFIIQSARVGTKFVDSLDKMGYTPLDVRFAKRLM